MRTLDRPAGRWGLVAAWVAANVILSHQPTVPLPGIPGIDKVSHALEYALLAFLLARAVFPALRCHPRSQRWAFVVLCCFIYGLGDEIHQAFVPGRSCDPVDAAADASGALLLALLLVHLRRKRWVRRAGVD